MEYVLVMFPTSRPVEIDGQPYGQTGDVLELRPGHHTFDLGNPPDYTPVFQNVLVAGTTPVQPLEVLFQPATAAMVAFIQNSPKKKRRSKGKTRKT